MIINIVRLARLIPRSVGQRVFSVLGGMAYNVLKADRKRAVNNMAIALPDSNEIFRKALTRAMFKNLGRNVFDFLNLEGSSAEKLAGLVDDVRGMEHFEGAEKAGKGVIVITGHIGCWEIMPAYFASMGYTASVVARRLKDSGLNDRVIAVRRSLGVTTIDRDDSPREMVNVLRRGELLGVLIDQHTKVSGTYVPFFNKPAFTPTGVAKLSCMTGASVIPMAVYLNRNGKHTIHVLPAIKPPSEISDREEAIESLTAEYSLAVEQLIRVDPKQWVWFHHRWREPETTNVSYAAHA